MDISLSKSYGKMELSLRDSNTVTEVTLTSYDCEQLRDELLEWFPLDEEG